MAATKTPTIRTANPIKFSSPSMIAGTTRSPKVATGPKWCST